MDTRPARTTPWSTTPWDTTLWITCGLCGHRFNPAEHIACGSCPLQRNCNLTCCPSCGCETVDPGRSKLASLFKRWLSLEKPYLEDHPVQRSLPR